MLAKAFKFLSSLRLTVALLALGIVVVFFGTLAQTTDGLWMAQKRYFQSWFATWSPHTAPWLVVPMPGGYLLGTLLLANLIVAHATRFKFSWKKSGIIMSHLGIILLLLGQLITDLFALESRMSFAEGDWRNYTEDFQKTELAILTDTTDAKMDQVVAIPESILATQSEIKATQLPFSIRVKEYFENSTVRARGPMVDTHRTSAATQGVGAGAIVDGRPPTREMNMRNLPSVVVEATSSNGSLGTWLFALVLDPQVIRVEGKEFRVTLRQRRYYQPFSVRLLKTTHEVYQGTDEPKNFQSRVRLEHPNGVGDREVDIYMNNPLRYEGLTFFQSQMGREELDREQGPQGRSRGTSVLQVVQNPGWITPYVGCILVGGGLLVQFLIHLVGFITQRIPSTTSRSPKVANP